TSRVNRAYLRERGIAAVIPEKSNEIAARKRKGRAGGRPPGFDAELYKDRNVVERAFGLMKQWRGLATRYDKLAVTYRAGGVLAAILVWVRISETRHSSMLVRIGRTHVAGAVYCREHELPYRVQRCPRVVRD